MPPIVGHPTADNTSSHSRYSVPALFVDDSLLTRASAQRHRATPPPYSV
ncbi:hypothetical protein OROGR_028587 [Orobanche gracilis]